MGANWSRCDDAARYITKPPKAEHDAEEWQAAMQALLLVAEHDGPTMLARIGMMRALHRHKPKAAPAPRRKRTKAYPRRKESSESFSRLEAGQFIKLARTFNTFLESYSSKLDLNKDVKFAMGENYLYVIRGGLLKAARNALQDVQK